MNSLSHAPQDYSCPFCAFIAGDKYTQQEDIVFRSVPNHCTYWYTASMNPPSTSEVTHHYAGVFLVTASGKIIGQQRDNKPTIDNPNRIGSFGGTVEEGEDFAVAAWRELVEEETNLKINKEDIRLYFEDVAWRELTNEWEGRHFYFAKITDSDLGHLEVYEGQGWAEIKSPEDKLLIDLWRKPVEQLLSVLESH